MLKNGDIDRVKKLEQAAMYHDEYYSWGRIRKVLEDAQKTSHNIGSPKLRDLVRECIARPTISTTQVLVVLYAEFPQLSGDPAVQPVP